jgi:hypothetical protein
MNRILTLKPSLLAGACTTVFLMLTACGGGGSPAPSAAPPVSTLKYVKICINGDEAGKGSCPTNPGLNYGTKPTDWGCTRDLATGLTWEVSRPYRNEVTREDDLLFTNYTTQTLQQIERVTDPDPVIPQTTYLLYPTAIEISAENNALGYANTLNALDVTEALCGMKQWRIPHSSELVKLSINYLLDTYIPGQPRIPANLLVDDFFPDTLNEPYLTSSLTPYGGMGKDGSPDLYTDNVWFSGDGIASLAQPPAGTVFAYTERKTRRALRLVADPCATCFAVADAVGTRWLTQSTVLKNGKVLVTGGSTTFAEVYDPSTQVWSQIPGMPTTGLPINRHTSTLLPNGNVLIVGGVDASNSHSQKTWLFDPIANTWIAGPNMTDRHAGHTATQLGNGNIVIVGGDCPFGAQPCYSGSTELYDASANRFTSLAPMPFPVKHGAAALVAGNKIFVAGGVSGAASAVAQMYDTATNTWRVLSTTLSAPRYYHTATALQDGRVLIVGGYNGQAGTGGRWNSSNIYDPATDRISLGQNMQTRRFTHTATLLADGQVLVTGGAGLLNDGTSTKSVEYFDPVSNQWLETCSLLTPRGGHTAALLNDGSLLIAGGIEAGANGSNSLKTAQIWRR